MPKISICIIAKNEEQMLPDCLASVKSIAHEIILVDTGSTDNTKKIAQNYGCKIFDFPWIDDFAAARNESLKYVTGDFVLALDADERLIDTQKIIETVANANSDVGGWLCQMISTATTSDANIQTNVTTVLRLFRYHPKFAFNGIIHEQIGSSIVAEGYKLKKSDVKILHIGYDLPESEMQKKHLRNFELLEKLLEKIPENDYYNNYYKTHKGKTLSALGKPQEALEYFLSFVFNIDDKNPIKVDALNNAATAARAIQDFAKAMELIKNSLELNPNQAFANCVLGDLFAAKNNHAEALEAYLNMQKAIENIDFVATISGELHIAPEQVHWKIGRAFMGIGEYNDAILAFEKGLKHSPNDPFCLIGIANVAFKLRKFAETKRVLEVALQKNPAHSEIKTFINQVDEILSAQNTQNINMQNATVGNSTVGNSTVGNSTVGNTTVGNTTVGNSTVGYSTVGTVGNFASNRKLLSLCMIVKNEEKMLAGCLESAKNVVDEIIIVDTGSTDKTKEIAKSYGCKMFDFAWIGDFSAARNESLKYATSEWILYLDADERLMPSSQNHIRSLLSTAGMEVGGYFCTIESDHFQMDGSVEKHRGGYPRLFRNLGYPNINFVGRVHEQISPSLISMRKAILISDIVIEHLGYNLSQEEMDAKVRRNYNMLLAHINEEPTNSYAWFQLGQTLGRMQLRDEAESATRFAIQCGNLSGSVYASAAATLSQFCGQKKNYEEALYWANESLSKAPEQAYGLSLKAHSLLYMGRKQEAKEVFLLALEKIKSNAQMPKSGFDIDISEETLLKGLQQANG